VPTRYDALNASVFTVADRRMIVGGRCFNRLRDFLIWVVSL